MSCYTIQLAHYRVLKDTDYVLADTTVKSGDARLAPTWDMVRMVKNALPGDAEAVQAAYTEAYVAMLRMSYANDPVFFHDLIRTEKLVLACFCPHCTFCHRYILIDFLMLIAELITVPFRYCGEILKSGEIDKQENTPRCNLQLTSYATTADS